MHTHTRVQRQNLRQTPKVETGCFATEGVVWHKKMAATASKKIRLQIDRKERKKDRRHVRTNSDAVHAKHERVSRILSEGEREKKLSVQKKKKKKFYVVLVLFSQLLFSAEREKEEKGQPRQ